MNARMWRKPGLLNARELPAQHHDELGIFIADVDVDVGCLDHPRSEQRAFDETVRIQAEIMAILERAGLALVALHRHQPRRRLLAHQRPLPSRGKSRATEAAQIRIADDLDDVVARALAGETIAEQRVAAGCAISRKIDLRLVRLGL